MSRLRRDPRWRLAAMATLPAALALGLAHHLGWFRGGWRGARAGSWQAVTGWDRVPGAPAPRNLVAVAPGDAVDLRWLGHSGFLLSWHGSRLLLDPHLGARCTLSPRLLRAPYGGEAARLAPVDAALVSHAHYDHLDLPTLAAVPGLPRLLLPTGSEAYARERFRRAGCGCRIEGLAPGDTATVGSLRVSAVAARHGGARHHPLAGRRLAVGWMIEGPPEGPTGERAAVYVAGDTGYGPHFGALGERFRPAVAILPIGAFAPAVPIGRVHLSPEEAVRAALDLGAGGTPPHVVPCHFGTFVLALDRPDQALPRFARAAARFGVRWSMPALAGGEAP